MGLLFGGEEHETTKTHGQGVLGEENKILVCLGAILSPRAERKPHACR